MTFLTLADVKASSIRRIANACPTSTTFLELVNEATERLMTRGDWATTVVPIHTCIKNGCVTFPRYVGQVRKMNLCGTPIPVSNIWSPYLDRSNYSSWYNFPNIGTWGDLSSYYSVGGSLRYHPIGANNTGYYSVYSDPWGDRYIRAYSQFPQDFGKTLTIFGTDESGQPLTTKNTAADGTVTYAPGAKITLAAPFGSTSVKVRAPIERVIKDVTQGRVWLYGYNDATANDLEDLAVYEPSETNPTYVRMQIPGKRFGNSCSGSNCEASVMAIVKLQFIPAANDEDLILIPNKAALKTMVQAIIFEESNDSEQAKEFESRAIRELNLQLRDVIPEDQTAIEIDGFNQTGVGVQRMY
jgi:hypothetical protein